MMKTSSLGPLRGEGLSYQPVKHFHSYSRRAGSRASPGSKKARTMLNFADCQWVAFRILLQLADSRQTKSENKSKYLRMPSEALSRTSNCYAMGSSECSTPSPKLLLRNEYDIPQVICLWLIKRGDRYCTTIRRPSD